MNMFKKLPFAFFVSLFVGALQAQTIVSTSPEDQNVVLEEFTGIHCVYCPQGHAIAKTIQDANPDRVSLINIHVGSYANPGPGEPDFRTPYGSAIVGQSGLTGYPAGTINRHVFPGRENTPGKTAMYRNFWTISANETMAKPSPVNVGVEAIIDVSTNVLTVHVEAYYTANSPQATNMLNVALLQNNTKGPQVGGNMCDEYNHMHRLVEMITGQWGEQITTTTSGTFVDRTYTYPIPADYNNIPVELADLEVVAFMAESHQEIYSGNRAYPSFNGFAHANDANVRYVVDFENPCANYLAPQVNVQNLGSNTLSSLTFEYSVNGGTPEVYNWSGSIAPMYNQTIDLPAMRFNIEATNTLTVSTSSDDDNTNNATSASFDKAYDATTTVNMELHTDQYGSECRWNVTDFDGNIIYSGGPYGANQTINETFNLPANCYTFNIIDTYGDGGGPVTLTDTDANNTVIFQTDGNFGCGDTIKFSTDGFVLGTSENQLDAISLYPNPSSNVVNVLNAENADIQIFNVLGKLVLSKENLTRNAQINVSELQTGTYFVRISKESQSTTKRLVVARQ